VQRRHRAPGGERAAARPEDLAAVSGPLYAGYGLHGDVDRQSGITGSLEAGKVLSGVGVVSSRVVTRHPLMCDEPGADLEIGLEVVDPACRVLASM
jgi:hypothetical protein